MWNIPPVVHTSFTLHLYNVTKAGRKIRYYSILLSTFIVLHFICICCLYSTLLSTYVFPLMRLVQPFFVDFIYGFCYYIFDVSCMFKIIYGHAVLIHNSYIPSTLLTYYLLLPILIFFFFSIFIYLKKLLVTLLLLMDIEFRVLDRPVVQADIIIKKIIKRLSQIDKTIKSWLNVDLLLFPKTAKVKKLPHNPKSPTPINRIPSIQNVEFSI